MNFVIQQNIPICPNCSALMTRRYGKDKELYFVCPDCNAIYKFMENGQTDNELIVTDESNG